MRPTYPLQRPSTILLSLALATPGAAFAYGTEDAIRDCENRIRSEYHLTDLREAHASQLSGDKHYRIEGKAKVDGDKHPWSCEVKDRHVTRAEYDGPRAKGMSTGEKLAVGAAAAVAIGVAANQASKHQDESQTEGYAQTGRGGSGAAGLQDLVGGRASSGEAEFEQRGYEFISTEKGGGSAYSTWRKGSHCVTARTQNGRYSSIVDATMADCEKSHKYQGSRQEGQGGSGAADLQDLVGARGAGGETELQNRGYNVVAGNKWSNGWKCVKVRTSNGRYSSIVDVPMNACH